MCTVGTTRLYESHYMVLKSNIVFCRLLCCGVGSDSSHSVGGCCRSCLSQALRRGDQTHTELVVLLVGVALSVV